MVVSLCAGDGRDVLPILAAVRPDARTLLVEWDPDLAAAARESAAAAGLAGVEVVSGDAGRLAAYSSARPADLLLACGVFGNVSDADVVRTVSHLPLLLAPGGRVVWTRGATVPDDPTEVEGDAALWVRGVFDAAGFEEEVFVRPDDAGFRVGVHRWPVGATPALSREDASPRMFEFVPAKR
jgi:hypothetical protein